MSTSMVVGGLTDSGADGRWAESLLAGEALAAPLLMPVEAANTLRRAALGGDISADVASLAHAEPARTGHMTGRSCEPSTICLASAVQCG